MVSASHFYGNPIILLFLMKQDGGGRSAFRLIVVGAADSLAPTCSFVCLSILSLRRNGEKNQTQLMKSQNPEKMSAPEFISRSFISSVSNVEIKLYSRS